MVVSHNPALDAEPRLRRVRGQTPVGFRLVEHGRGDDVLGAARLERADQLAREEVVERVAVVVQQ